MLRGLKILIALPLGILVGILIANFLPLKVLGNYKTEVVGFLPYFLLDRADKNYSDFITQLSYFGLNIDSDGSIIQLQNSQQEDPGWHTLKSDKLKGLLSQSSENHVSSSLLVQALDEATISGIISDPKAHAQNLLKDVVPQMQKYGYSDLNLDIESFKESSPSARQSFTDFVKAVSDGLKTQQPNSTLSIDIAPSALINNYILDVGNLGKIVDFVTLMAYDYDNLSSPVTGPVSPLGGASKIREVDVNFSLQQILNVVPPQKLLLGIPLYGYEWETLTQNPSSPTIPGTGQVASSRRISELLKNCKNCQTGFDSVGQEPYIIFPDEKDPTFHQIYYEDQNALQQKIDLAKKYKLRGLALWALGYEDDKLLNPLRGYK